MEAKTPKNPPRPRPGMSLAKLLQATKVKVTPEVMKRATEDELVALRGFARALLDGVTTEGNRRTSVLGAP